MSTDFAVILRDERAAIQALAPKFVNVDKLNNLAIQAISRNQDLAKCSTISVVKFCKTCAEWGTDRIGAGGVWPVAFKTELVAIPDWRFVIQKAKDAKVIKHAYAEAVYSNDEFRASRGMFPALEHNLAANNRGEIVGVYCVIVLPDDSRDFTYMEWREIEVIRDRAPAGKKGPWLTDAVQMGLKTVIKRALKPFEGASPELTKIMQADNSAMGYIDVDPEPIAMPKRLPPKQATTVPETAPATNTQSKPADKPKGNIVEGLITKVIYKKSKADAKKAWERWGVEIDGTIYGTFDEKNGTLAEGCKKEGVPVRLTVEKSGEYWNLLTIDPLKTPIDAKKEDKKAETKEEPEDDLPDSYEPPEEPSAADDPELLKLM